MSTAPAAAAAVASADPTQSLIDQLNQPSRWKIRRSVPVFDEHDEYGKDGRLQRRFGPQELQEIADSCNRRERDTGDVCPLTKGHTIQGAPEDQQPEILGYARNFHVGRFGAAQKLGILADFYFYPDRYKVAMSFPRRSVELYFRDKILDPIALLRRTPQRDLGVLTDDFTDPATPPAYLPPGTVRLYGGDGAALPATYSRAKDRLRYSIDDFTLGNEDTMTQANANQPHTSRQQPSRYEQDEQPMEPAAGQQPGAEAEPEPDPEFHARFMHSMKHASKSYGPLKYLHDCHAKYSAEQAAEPPAEGAGTPPPAAPSTPPASGAPYQAGAGAAAGGNTFVPGLGGGRKEEPARMQRTQQQIRQVREERTVETRLQSLEQGLAAAQQENVQLKYERDRERSERVCYALEAEGYRIPDIGKEVERMARMSDEQRGEREQEIRQCYSRAPVGADLAGMVGGNPRPDAEVLQMQRQRPEKRAGREQPTQFGREQQQKALQYAQDHPDEQWPEIVKKFSTAAS